jgi:hypothetical protein
MGATSDNYNIVTSGTTYTIASDYVKPVGAGETAHHQIVKVAYGTNDTVNYVSSNAPLPVGLCGSWATYNLANGIYSTIATTVVGSLGTIPIAGISGGTAIGITVGTVTVTPYSGATFSIRYLAGGNGSGDTAGDYIAIQGLSGGFPVGITVGSAVPVTGSFGITGGVAVYGVSGATAIGITVGTVSIRGLTAASDTVTVYGGGTASTVSVGLFGFTGATASAIYADNNALNVNVKSFGVGIDGVTVSATNLDIRDLDYTTDDITVVGQGASDDASLATVPTYINARAANGNLYRVGGITGAGWCGAAINTYLVNSGFSFTASVTLGTAVGISQEYNNPIQVAGSTYAVTGVWVAGDTANGPVLVKGYSGGVLPVDLQSSTLVTESNFDTKIAQLKTNSDFLIATKKALYDPTVSVGALDFNDALSIYSLIKSAVNTQLQTIADTVNTSTGTIGVAVESYTLQPSFMSRTNYVSNTAKNLTEYNGNAGFTCANGIRIKVSRVATGANASQNEILCVISEADAALYGATAGTASYTMYHGDEMFFEVDNINKLKVFYPPYSLSFAPHNTGSGITFSFYAS